MIIRNMNKWDNININKFTLIGVPRTGGNVLALLFLQHFGYHPDAAHGFLWDNRIASTSHNNLDYVIGQHGEPFFNNSISFGCVRNPWDRFVSLVEFFSEDQGKSKWWSTNKKDNIKNYIKEYTTKKITQVHNLRSQLSWFKVNGEIAVDVILEYNTYQEDVYKLLDRMGLPRITMETYTGTNSPRTGETKDYYDKESYDMIKEIYKEEIEMFNFDLEL